MGLISTVLHSWDSCLPTITKGWFSGGCHSFYLFCLFSIHAFRITFIPPWVPSRDSNSVTYSRTAHYQLSYAAPWPSYATPCWVTLHPTELRCIPPSALLCALLSYVASYWATLHPAELRCNLLSYATCTLLSYAAPYWAMLHPTELRCTLTELRCVLQSAIIRQCWGRILKERMDSEKVPFQPKSRLFGY